MTGNYTTTQYLYLHDLHSHCRRYICATLAIMQRYNGIHPTFTFYYKTAHLASRIK